MDALRTTSTLESWHWKFNKKINFTNPTLENLFSNLQLKQCRVEKVLFSNDMGDNTSLINQASLKRYNRVKEIAQEPYSHKKRLQNLGKLALALIKNNLYPPKIVYT